MSQARKPRRITAEELDGRLGALRADRERIYVVMAYARPPGHLMMKLAASGKVWYRRGTGYFAAEVAAQLAQCGITGRIKPTGCYLAGTPKWIPYKRRETDDEPKGRRGMGPVELARIYLAAKGKSRRKGRVARAGKARPPQSRGQMQLAFREAPEHRVRQKRLRKGLKNAA